MKAGGVVKLKDAGAKGLMSEVVDRWAKRPKTSFDDDEEKPKKRQKEDGGEKVKKEKDPEAHLLSHSFITTWFAICGRLRTLPLSQRTSARGCLNWFSGETCIAQCLAKD